MKKQGKIKAIPVKEVTEGMQVLWENCMNGYIYTVIEVEENHFVIKAQGVQSYHVRLQKIQIHKTSIQTLVVEYVPNYRNEDGTYNRQFDTEQLSLKHSQWQAAIDNNEVDTDKTVEFEIISNGQGEKWIKYAKIITKGQAKKKYFSEEEILEIKRNAFLAGQNSTFAVLKRGSDYYAAKEITMSIDEYLKKY